MTVSLMEVRKKFCNSNVNCCVNGCKSVRNKTNNLMYHSFPKPGQQIEVTDDFGNVRLCERRKMWETNLRMTKKISKYMTVCSLHFKPMDYTCSGWSTRKRLLRTAVPTENITKHSSESRLQLSYATRRDKCNNLQKDIRQTRKKPWLNRLITEIETNTDVSNSLVSNEEDQKETSTLNRGIEFVDVNSINNNSDFVVNSELINYKSNVLSESVNIKIEYDPENIQLYEYLTDKYQQEFNIKTEIDIKEEIM